MGSMEQDIKNIFQYMKSVKKLNEKTIRSIDDYGKIKGEQKYFLTSEEVLNNNVSVRIYDENELKIEIYKEENENDELDVTDDFYNKIFKLYQFIELQGDDYELIYSDNILTWEFENTKIKHPLLINTMELKFEEEENKFFLQPMETLSTLELDFLEGLPIEGLSKLFKVKEVMKEDLRDFRNVRNSEHLLKKILGCLSGKDEEESSIEEFSTDEKVEFSKKPKLYKIPTLIFRKRSEKLDIKDIEEIIEFIDKGGKIPETIKALVTSNDEIEKNKDNYIWKDVSKDLLFPLPANEDQKEIARRLADNYGVVVQGPPGTGKSHTIVNLICHLLAHGKRILVTSQREKALSVLRDKIPSEIRSLCISVLGNDKDSIGKLDESIRNITDNISLDKDRLLQEIGQLEEDLRANSNLQKDLIEKITDIELNSNYRVTYKGEEYTFIEVAKWLRENREKYDFLKDSVCYGVEQPMTNEEYLDLVSLLNTVSKDEIQYSDEIIQLIDTFPKLYKLINLTKDLEKLKKKEEALKKKINGYSYDNSILVNIVEINNKLDGLIEELKGIESENLNLLLEKYNDDSYTKDITREFLDQGGKSINEISNIVKDLALKELKIPHFVDFKTFKKDFELVYNELRKNKKIGLMFKLTNKNSMYIMESCKVNNKTMENQLVRETIKKYIRKKELEEDFLMLWNNYAKSFNLKTYSEVTIENINILDESIKYIRSISELNEKYINPIKKLTGNNIPNNLNLYNYDDVLKLKSIFKSINEVSDILKINKQIDEYKLLFEKNKVTSGLDEYILNYNYDGIYEKYREFQRLISINKNVVRIKSLMEKLRTTMPIFYDDFKDNSKKYIALNFEEAFKYLSWRSLLDGVKEKDIQALEEELSIAKENERYLILNLVDKKTWYNQILNMTDSSKRSLYAWLEAMKKVGKGTGKYANYYKRLAKQEMSNCKKAIPVWIMPFNKVIENLSIEDEPFDVVIFDESSQSNIMALQALFRAKKAVVVGDDNQISPMVVGYNKEEQLKLIDTYLSDIPNREWFDLETSLYSTALRIFPNKLLLREHFRSVPEIIEFSNKFAYNGEIIPLRYPKINERFENAVIPCKVEEGYRHGDNQNKVNVPEAKALVNKIVECCKDPRHDNMTFGVISLLGSNQAELIESMLVKKLGKKEIIKRKLICGDAYSFQGDERDVIFLSMVVAKNMRFAALTKEEDRRRFNVAASRARNQMWLFHSIDLDGLNPNCARYELLEYFMNPERDFFESEEKRFTSNFEKDVYKMIKAKGYIVNTQVRVGRYTIDLVVEGRKNRLGIECDGDSWQGIDKWKSDRECINQLERVGWEFVRIRGCDFYLNPEDTMKKVFEKIEEMRIEKIISKKENLLLDECAATIKK